MDDHVLSGAYGFASLSLQIAILNALVMKGIMTTSELADVTALAAQSVGSATANATSPEMMQIAQQCLAGIAESWAKRGQN